MVNIRRVGLCIHPVQIYIETGNDVQAKPPGPRQPKRPAKAEQLLSITLLPFGEQAARRHLY